MGENPAIEELIRGQKSINQLKALLANVPTLKEDRGLVVAVQHLAAQVSDSFSRALISLQFNRSDYPVVPAQSTTAFSGHHGNAHPGKRRVIHPAKKITQRTRADDSSCTRVLQRTRDDGYSWRKYGRKDIIGSKFPRSYFRCTYKSDLNCQAIKHVQPSDDDPSMLEITYIREHTCNQRSSHKINFDSSSSAANQTLLDLLPESELRSFDALVPTGHHEDVIDVPTVQISKTFDTSATMEFSPPSTLCDNRVIIIPSPTCSLSELLEVAEVPELPASHASLLTEKYDVSSDLRVSSPLPSRKCEHGEIFGVPASRCSLSDFTVPKATSCNTPVTSEQGNFSRFTGI